MFEAQLDAVVRADPTTRERMIRELATRSEEVLPEVLTLLRSGLKPQRDAAVQVIQAIGYPQNASAIPTSLKVVADANALGRNEAIEAISSIEPEVIVPYLIDVLWDRGRTNAEWVDEMAGICMLLKWLDKKPYAHGCGPVIAYLLSQEIELEDYDPIYLLRVLESIKTDGTAYALPSLLDFAGREAVEPDLRAFALRLIASFPQEVLEPYARILPPLERVLGK